MKCSGRHPVVETGVDKFENGNIGLRGWWFNVFDVKVLFCFLNSQPAEQLIDHYLLNLK